MKKQILIFCTLLLGATFLPQLYAQNKNASGLTTEEIDRYKIQVDQLVSYFEGTLNFLGDPGNVAREKEIIINDSYLKIFKDDKVQVEDDLDESREVPLHKDAQAYLKDIEFFFRSVTFKFVISDITFNSNDNNLNFFKVTLNRELKGFAINGDSISNKKVRYMEINLDVASNDLRIASFYTTKLNEKEEKRNWWNGLPDPWRSYFGKDIIVYDTISLANVYFIEDSLILISDSLRVTEMDTSTHFSVELPPERQVNSSHTQLDSVYVNTKQLYNKISGILKQQSINVSGNEQIRNLEPLSKLSELTDINCSNTLAVSLFPLRNLNRLETLDVSNTPVDDLTALQFSTSLKELNCSFTLLEDLSPISGLYNLEKIICSGLRIYKADFTREITSLREVDLSETKINDLNGLSELVNLEELNVSETGITNLDIVASFINLRYLNAENTSVSNLDPLKDLKKLEVLKISNTAIDNLRPLDDLTTINRVYWDGNDYSVDKAKKKEEAIDFMNSHPGSLVIFESEDLMNGWKDLEEPWKQLARNIVQLSENPTKEELHALLQIEEIQIDTTPITTLKPIAQLYNLKSLSVPGLQVDDYQFIGEALELNYLDLSNTSVASVDFASSLKNLKEINFEGTAVEDIIALENLDELNIIYADNTGITETKALNFRKQNPGCSVIFKTDKLNSWWESLPKGWKSFFTTNFKLNSSPTKEQLHQLFYLEELELDNTQDIQALDPISELINLKVINFSNLNSGNLQFLTNFSELVELHCSKMPVVDLTPLSGLQKLEILNLEDTPCDDLKPIGSCTKLRELYISGTQIKSLKPVSSLTNLESIELNNTMVKSISPLFSLSAIKSLSCFNTKVSSKNIEKFKKEKPNCKVVYY